MTSGIQCRLVPENRNLFETIHDSLLVLCLDESYRSFDQTDAKRTDNQTIAGLNFLHGGGTSSNTANRWFDKTLQVILGPDGYCGLNYEHSMAEGGMITALVDYALSYWYVEPRTHPTGKSVRFSSAKPLPH